MVQNIVFCIIKNVTGARKLMKKFSAKIWKKIEQNFLNWLKELTGLTENRTHHLVSGNLLSSCFARFCLATARQNRAKQLLSKFPLTRWCVRFSRLLTSRMVVFIPHK